MATRPCFLIVDHEHAGTISTRKLVLETAKFNVITVASCNEGIETLERFPRVNGLVIDSAVPEAASAPLLDALNRHPQVKLILVGQPLAPPNPGRRAPDLVVDSFSPQMLLNALLGMYPEHAANTQFNEESVLSRRA